MNSGIRKIESYLIMCLGYLLAILILTGGIYFIYKIARQEDVKRSLKAGVEIEQKVVRYDSKLVQVGVGIMALGIVLGFLIVSLGSVIKRVYVLEERVNKKSLE